MTKEIIIMVLLFAVFVWSTYKSLVYLKSKSTVNTYYEFGLKIPGTSAWSATFYLIIILLLLITAFIFMQQTHPLLPPA